MEFKTISKWDELFWAKAAAIYQLAFEGKGAKPEKVIQNMFRKGICYLHIGIEENQVLAMAMTGKLSGIQGLLIDYLAVHPECQNRGIGKMMVARIKDWGNNTGSFERLVIEVEAEPSPENLARKHFWQTSGFVLTEYIHHYIWVPETYQAMYLDLVPDTNLLKDGKELFEHISKFHKASYQGA